MKRQIVLTALLASSNLLGCASPTEIALADENGRAFATLEHYGDPVRVQVPSEVPRGAEFRVTVYAYGGGCVAKGETESKTQGLQSVITPYEYDGTASLPPNAFCTLNLRVDKHEATIRFDRPGHALVMVRGQRKPSREIITIRRTVVVK